MREKVNVLVIENTECSLNIFKDTFEIGHRDMIPELFEFKLIPCRIFPEQGAPLEENRKRIIELIEAEDYKVIIFDLMLRNIAEGGTEIPEFLSIKIANEMSEFFNVNKICVVFSSDPKSIKDFYTDKKNYPEIIQDNWHFIKKPLFYEGEPRGIPICSDKCSNKYRWDRVPPCNRATCFLFKLADRYDSFKNLSIGAE